MSTQTANDSAEMTFGEHLDELRKILIRVALVFALLFIVLFTMKGVVLKVVFAPITPEFPTNRLFTWLATAMGSDALNIHPENVQLFNNKMAGQFMLHIKSSVVGALVVAFPFLIWQLWLRQTRTAATSAQAEHTLCPRDANMVHSRTAVRLLRHSAAGH